MRPVGESGSVLTSQQTPGLSSHCLVHGSAHQAMDSAKMQEAVRAKGAPGPLMGICCGSLARSHVPLYGISTPLRDVVQGHSPSPWVPPPSTAPWPPKTHQLLALVDEAVQRVVHDLEGLLWNKTQCAYGAHSGLMLCVKLWRPGPERGTPCPCGFLRAAGLAAAQTHTDCCRAPHTRHERTSSAVQPPIAHRAPCGAAALARENNPEHPSHQQAPLSASVEGTTLPVMSIFPHSAFHTPLAAFLSPGARPHDRPLCLTPAGYHASSQWLRHCPPVSHQPAAPRPPCSAASPLRTPLYLSPQLASDPPSTCPSCQPPGCCLRPSRPLPPACPPSPPGSGPAPTWHLSAL